MCARRVCGQGIAVDASSRYFKDAQGTPVFLLGYYDWASVAPSAFMDAPSRYQDMIVQGAAYGINYVRISLGINFFDQTTNPTSWDGQPTSTPFLYVNGAADLSQWDPVFWAGLRYHIELAAQNDVIVHVALFDGVDLRGGRRAISLGGFVLEH